MRFRRDPEAVRADYQCPVLIWEIPSTAEGEHWETTQGQALRHPTPGDPRIFRVVKGDKAQNAFSLGITLGRVANNDLVLEADSVSRFHAFLRQGDRGQGWFVTDADSKNGTWVGDTRLQPSERCEIKDGTKLRFGDAELTFMLPASFMRLVNQ